MAAARSYPRSQTLGERVYRKRAVIGNIIAFTGFLIVWFDPYANITIARLIVGSLIGLAGFALRIWAASYQWPNIAKDLPEARTGLITAGPYSYVRHPIYLGLLLFIIGAFIGLGSWIAAIVVLVPSLVLNLWQVRYEEAYLVRKYGEQALRYQRHLPLLLPKFWDPYPDRFGSCSLAQGIKHDVGPLSSFVCFIVAMLIVTAYQTPTLLLTLLVLVFSVIFSFFLTWLVRVLFEREFSS